MGILRSSGNLCNLRVCFFLHNLIISVKHNCNAHLLHRFFWWDPLFHSAQLNGRGCLTPPVFQEMKQVRRTSWQHGASENSMYKTMPEFPLNSILLITNLYIYTIKSLDICIILIQRGQETFGSSMVTFNYICLLLLEEVVPFPQLTEQPCALGFFGSRMVTCSYILTSLSLK